MVIRIKGRTECRGGLKLLEQQWIDRFVTAWFQKAKDWYGICLHDGFYTVQVTTSTTSTTTQGAEVGTANPQVATRNTTIPTCVALREGQLLTTSDPARATRELLRVKRANARARVRSCVLATGGTGAHP